MATKFMSVVSARGKRGRETVQCNMTALQTRGGIKMRWIFKAGCAPRVVVAVTGFEYPLSPAPATVASKW